MTTTATTDPIKEVAQMAAAASQALRNKPLVQTSSRVVRLLKAYREEHPSCTINRWVSENGLAPLEVDSRCDLCKETDRELALLELQ